MKRTAIALAKSLVAVVLRRQVVFLPRGSRGIVFGVADEALLPLRYTYRTSPEGQVSYQFQEGGSNLRYALRPVAFSDGRPLPGGVCLSFTVPGVVRGDILRVGLVDRTAWLNDQPVAIAWADHEPARKFRAELELSNRRGRQARVCSHYLPFADKPIGRDYYFGDDYVDYPQQSDAAGALKLVRRYCTGGRLLDVGCALGIYTKAFRDARFDAYGLDVSEFAIIEAAKRVGTDRVRQCNLDVSDVPFEFTFDVVWMWDVLEHSADPERLLKKVTSRVAPGSWLFLNTANADSLTHRIFGADWEGHSDYSHYGADKVSAASLAEWLRELDWEVVDWECTSIWAEGVDPVISRLRETFDRIPELSMLLAERDLGDFIRVVARRRGSAKPSGKP